MDVGGRVGRRGPWHGPDPTLEPGWIDLAGSRRTYWLAPAPQPGAPLLVVLHGAGSTGHQMAALTGLAGRGPAAGFATVFPDGWRRVWNDGRAMPSRAGVDDVGFIQALVSRLVSDGTARPGALFLVGISNGALMSEHLARHALVPATGIVLVAGTATARSREASPRPAGPVAVLCFEGTADPLMPYGGGPIGLPGPVGRMVTRTRRRRPETGRGMAVAAETVMADWAGANGIPAGPSLGPVAGPPGEPPVTVLRWEAPGRPPVVLYRVEGGGHTWPGGPQYLPARLIGPVARQLDATGILLDLARAQAGSPG